MAPLPKPPGQTERRNLDQPNWTTLTAADVPADVPDFPGRKPSVASLVYWTAIWTSPLASMFIGADQLAIARLCRIHSKVEQGKGSAAELSELRQLEQLYGLSPRARRQLQWEVERAAGPGAAHEPNAIDEVRARRDERRRRLSG